MFVKMNNVIYNNRKMNYNVAKNNKQRCYRDDRMEDNDFLEKGEVLR